MIPDCIEETVAGCQALLSADGYVAGQVFGMFSQTVDSGLIAATFPAAGTAADAGTIVNMYLSQGAQGFTMWNQAFWGVLVAFQIGIFIGLFIKLTNKS